MNRLKNTLYDIALKGSAVVGIPAGLGLVITGSILFVFPFLACAGVHVFCQYKKYQNNV